MIELYGHLLPLLLDVAKLQAVADAKGMKLLELKDTVAEVEASCTVGKLLVEHKSTALDRTRLQLEVGEALTEFIKGPLVTERRDNIKVALLRKLAEWRPETGAYFLGEVSYRTIVVKHQVPSLAS